MSFYVFGLVPIGVFEPNRHHFPQHEKPFSCFSLRHNFNEYHPFWTVSNMLKPSWMQRWTVGPLVWFKTDDLSLIDNIFINIKWFSGCCSRQNFYSNTQMWTKLSTSLPSLVLMWTSLPFVWFKVDSWSQINNIFIQVKIVLHFDENDVILGQIHQFEPR